MSKKMMDIETIIKNVKNAFISDGSFPDEYSITQQAVVPILSGLEWPIFDMCVVKHQYRLGSLKPDIALFDKGELKVLIEVKTPGTAEGGEAQLFQYAFEAGDSKDAYNTTVSLVVLTTGKEWEFYLPWKPGGSQGRQVCKIDISVLKTEESASKLMRYLFYPDVCSGKADEMAEADHGDKARAKKIHDALPKAWGMLLSECDDSLIALLQDKVEDICDFRPDYDVVKAFSIKQSEKTLMLYQPKQSVPSNFVRKPIPQSNKPRTKSNPKLAGFELYGRRYEARNGVETLVAFWEAMIERDSALPNQVERLASKSKKRCWLASNKRDLYPAHPDLCEERSRQLSTGHWISTNYSRKDIETIIVEVGKVANINQKDIKFLYK